VVAEKRRLLQLSHPKASKSPKFDCEKRQESAHSKKKGPLASDGLDLKIRRGGGFRCGKRQRSIGEIFLG